MKRFSTFQRDERGEGESSFLMIILGLCVLVSSTLFVLDWIKSVKEARLASYGSSHTTHYSSSGPDQEPGAYEVTY